MSSGGFGLVEGLGWVCLSIAREVGLSIAEISASVIDAHDIVFRQTAVQFQEKTLARIQAADMEWDQLRLSREKRLTSVRSGINAASRSVESDARALGQLQASVASRHDAFSAAKSTAIARLRDIQAGVGRAASALSSAPLPASSELEASVQTHVSDMRSVSAAVVSVARRISNASSPETVRSVQREVASVASSARSVARQVDSYAVKAVKAETEYSETAAAISRARVGTILLEESPYPAKAKAAAEKVTGPLAHVDSALRKAQQALASGGLQEAKSAARQYESVVERGQAAALRTTVQIAKKQIANREKLAARKIDVDTSGSIIIKIEDSTKPEPVVGKLQTLIDEVRKGSTDLEFGMPKRDRSKDVEKRRSSRSRGVTRRKLR